MAKKQRKTRDYSSLLRNNNSAELPSPEEVNEKVSAITKQPLKKTTPKQYPTKKESEIPIANDSVMITEYHLMKDEEFEEQPAKVTPQKKKTTKAKAIKEVVVVENKRGRKPLEVKRSPYTTSITKEHKFQIKYHAMKTGIRPSDMLDLILEKYFNENKI